MKKVYLTLLTALSTLPLLAQQLPDPGFEKDWVTCYPWTSTTNNTTKTKSQGTTHPDWTVSNTIGTGSKGNTTIGSNVAGKNSGHAIQVENLEITVKFIFSVTQTIPGYFTLGTPWSTSVTNSNNDGGTFGGFDFKYRPDALSFDYQSAGSSDQPTVVAYSWKDEYNQANVPANIVAIGSATKVTMVNRERNILGMSTEQGGDVTKKGTLISVINSRLTAETAGWDIAELPFDYKTTDIPEKINVIFAAGNYFTTSPIKENKLTVDNIRLLYFSRLSSLSVNGVQIPNFDSKKFEYTMSSTPMPTDVSAISYTLLGNSGSSVAEVSLDYPNHKVIITVVNATDGDDATDYDGAKYHTYTITFEEPVKYSGDISMTLGDMQSDGTIPATIYIINNSADGSNCTFALPDFDMGDGAYLGDIIVENVVATSTGNKTTYSGFKEGLKLNLLGQDIVADAEVTGTSTSDGEAKMIINVIWHSEDGDVPIIVEFKTSGWVDEPDDPNNGEIILDGDRYDGIVTIHPIDGLSDSDLNVEGCVYITVDKDDASKCTLTLPDFNLGSEDSKLGDIVVKDVTRTESAGGYSYNGVCERLELSLMGETITAKVNVSGTSRDNGECSMKIDVVWFNDETEIPIYVDFNGRFNPTGIDDVIADQDELNAPVEYYNIQGMKVNGSNLAPGFYIRKQGSQTEKILVK